MVTLIRFPAVYEAPKFRYRIRESPPLRLVPSLWQSLNVVTRFLRSNPAALPDFSSGLSFRVDFCTYSLLACPLSHPSQHHLIAPNTRHTWRRALNIISKETESFFNFWRLLTIIYRKKFHEFSSRTQRLTLFHSCHVRHSTSPKGTSK